MGPAKKLALNLPSTDLPSIFGMVVKSRTEHVATTTVTIFFVFSWILALDFVDQLGAASVDVAHRHCNRAFGFV